MIIAARGVHSPAGFIAVLVLHCLGLVLLLRDHADTEHSPAPRYSRLLFIVPPSRPVVAEERRQPVIQAETRRMARSIPAKIILPAVPDIAAAPENMDAPAPVENTEAPAPPTRLNIEDLVKQAGKADRETRPANESQAYGPAPDSIEAVMTKAFTAAKLAVPLKWYEAARIELFSAPNDPKKIYQVKTAFGTYCLFYPSMYEEVGGGASARQPRISSCPRRFGRGAK